MNNIDFNAMRSLATERALAKGQEVINKQVTKLKSWLQYQLGILVMELDMSEKNVFNDQDQSENEKKLLRRMGEFINVSAVPATGNEKSAKLCVDTGDVQLVGKLKEAFDMAFANAKKMALAK